MHRLYRVLRFLLVNVLMHPVGFVEGLLGELYFVLDECEHWLWRKGVYEDE